MEKKRKKGLKEYEDLDIGSDGLDLTCCDCGLVHTLKIVTVMNKGRVMMRATRLNRNTAQVRRRDSNLELKNPIRGDKWKMVRIRGS